MKLCLANDSSHDSNNGLCARNPNTVSNTIHGHVVVSRTIEKLDHESFSLATQAPSRKNFGVARRFHPCLSAVVVWFGRQTTSRSSLVSILSFFMELTSSDGDQEIDEEREKESHRRYYFIIFFFLAVRFHGENSFVS